MKTMQIEALLPKNDQDRLQNFLYQNLDIFAWLASNMPGMPLEVITHKLNVDLKYKLVLQKKNNFAPKKYKVIDKKVDKLLVARFIQEAHYLDQQVNVIMVKKINRKW